jgi:CubicO group peptidase (beta-lactamase class C family)
MGVSNLAWENDVSGLRSRDMLKCGLLALAKRKWQGEQLIPAAFVERATSPISLGYGKSYYGFFWWVEDPEVGGKTYHCVEGRGAGGQFIFAYPELDLIAVITAHQEGMSNMLTTAPSRILPSFVAR